MSKTQLQTNNSRLASLITELEGKAAGGGSGGSVETCSVRIYCTTNDIFGYTYLAYRDGGFVPVITMTDNATTLDVTLTDVICGSYIYVQTFINVDGVLTAVTGDATVEFAQAINIGNYAVVYIYTPVNAGGEATVRIKDDY